MRGLRLGLVILAATMLTLALGGLAYAFHSGGVAECGGCHSMHNPAQIANNFLLIKSDQSSTCLNCHQETQDTGPSSYHISSRESIIGVGINQPGQPQERTPGGDFGWLKKTFQFTVRSEFIEELGDTHGHNIVAADFNYNSDSSNATAPGGSFPAAQLACTSCHDPHGKNRRLPGGTIARTGGPIIGSGSYDNSATPAAGQAVGVFRLLRGGGDTVAGVTFTANPAAVAPSTYNRSESATQTRVAYGAITTAGNETWGQWCASCHPDMHTSGGKIVHPIDQNLGSTMATAYANYVSSGINNGSFQAGQGPYLSLVPFAESATSYAQLASHAKNGTYLNGPSGTDQVMCLSCHRAHATGFPEMLRWQMEGEFITRPDSGNLPSWPGIDGTGSASAPQFARGRTLAQTQAAYYDRPATVFGTAQRVLCNKCHVQD